MGTTWGTSIATEFQGAFTQRARARGIHLSRTSGDDPRANGSGEAVAMGTEVCQRSESMCETWNLTMVAEIYAGGQSKEESMEDGRL